MIQVANYKHVNFTFSVVDKKKWKVQSEIFHNKLRHEIKLV